MAKSNLENAKHRIGDIKVKNDAMEIAPAIGTKFLVKPTEKPKTDNTKSGK